MYYSQVFDRTTLLFAASASPEPRLFLLSNLTNGQVDEGADAKKVTYDPQTDSLTICLCDKRIKEGDEVRPGLIVDFGYDDDVFRCEIMRASKVAQITREIQSAVGERRTMPATPPQLKRHRPKCRTCVALLLQRA